MKSLQFSILCMVNAKQIQISLSIRLWQTASPNDFPAQSPVPADVYCIGYLNASYFKWKRKLVSVIIILNPDPLHPICFLTWPFYFGQLLYLNSNYCHYLLSLFLSSLNSCLLLYCCNCCHCYLKSNILCIQIWSVHIMQHSTGVVNTPHSIFTTLRFRKEVCYCSIMNKPIIHP